MVADVALVGLPNVGKSTLISAVSAAKPKVADYPFTTLQPHLGVVRAGGRTGHDDVEFVMADVPGLVEGAAEGKGLGHQFLRHIERARCLVILLDLAMADETTPSDQLAVLRTELSRYQPTLLERPSLVVGSRADLVADVSPGPPCELVVSAATGHGVAELLGRLATLVTEAREAEATPSSHEVVVHRPAPEGARIERVAAGEWRIAGRAAERAVAFSDLNDDGAMDEAVRRLRRLGVDRSLARAGARDGDLVSVGAVSFTWYREGPDGQLDRSEEDDEPRRRPRGTRSRR
jgi:GTP-binding protein